MRLQCQTVLVEIIKMSHIYATVHFSLLTQELPMVLALCEDCLLGSIGIVMPAAGVIVS